MSAGEKTSDDDPLIALADRAIEGRLSRRDVAELERLLDQGLPNAQKYVQYVGLHAALHELSAETLLDRVPAALREAELAPARAARRRARLRSAAVRLASAAAVLLVAALAGWYFYRPVVASVAQLSSQAAWVEPRDDPRVRVDDELRLASGFADVRFLNGVELSLRGPALLRVESAEEVHLEFGQVLARVPPDAAGFAVRTPDGRLVDLGTEFLVSRGAGARTSTTVRKGLIVAETGGAARPKQIAANEAAAFDPGSKGWVDSTPDSASLSAFDLKALGFEILSGNVLLGTPDCAFPAVHPSGQPGVVFLPERQAARLTAAVEALGPDGEKVILPAGTVVNSYLLDGIGNGRDVWDAHISIVSSRPIAAALVYVPGLRATDPVVGLPDLEYPRPRHAGVEVDHPSGLDGVAISRNGRRIDIRLSASPYEREQVRILIPLGTAPRPAESIAHL